MSSIPESIIALEQAEREAFTDVYHAAGPDVVAMAGLSVTPLTHSVVLAANRIDVLALNRVLGLGLHGPVPDGSLDEVLDTLASCGSPRFFVPLAPVPGHDALARALEGRGLRRYNNWIRLARDLNDIPTAPPTDVQVSEIDRTSASTFGRIVATAFEYPPAVAPLAGLTVGRPGWRHYLAYDGDVPIAAAAMYLTDDAVWFGFAATDAAHRGRGAQQSLVVRRLRDAAAAGCSHVSVETAEDTVTKDAPSFRNLKRLGFKNVYTRPNYLWTNPAP